MAIQWGHRLVYGGRGEDQMVREVNVILDFTLLHLGGQLVDALQCQAAMVERWNIKLGRNMFMYVLDEMAKRKLATEVDHEGQDGLRRYLIAGGL